MDLRELRFPAAGLLSHGDGLLSLGARLLSNGAAQPQLLLRARKPLLHLAQTHDELGCVRYCRRFPGARRPLLHETDDAESGRHGEAEQRNRAGNSRWSRRAIVCYVLLRGPPSVHNHPRENERSGGGRKKGSDESKLSENFHAVLREIDGSNRRSGVRVPATSDGALTALRGRRTARHRAILLLSAPKGTIPCSLNKLVMMTVEQVEDVIRKLDIDRDTYFKLTDQIPDKP